LPYEQIGGIAIAGAREQGARELMGLLLIDVDGQRGVPAPQDCYFAGIRKRQTRGRCAGVTLQPSVVGQVDVTIYVQVIHAGQEQWAL